MPQAPYPVPLINGNNFDWGSIRLSLLNNNYIVYGVTSIEYGRKQLRENNYGIGNEPISRGFGNYEYSCTMDLYKDELVAMAKSTGFLDILDIPSFNIVVSYQKGTNIYTDILNNALFMENPVKTKQNDTKIIVTVPILIAGIKYNQ